MTVQILHPIPEETLEVLAERLFTEIYPYTWSKQSPAQKARYINHTKNILEGYKVEKHD